MKVNSQTSINILDQAVSVVAINQNKLNSIVNAMFLSNDLGRTTKNTGIVSTFWALLELKS